MTVDRRGLLTGGLTLGGAGLTALAGARAAGSQAVDGPATADMRRAITSAEAGLIPDAAEDQTKRLQAAIDIAAERRVALVMAPGRYRAAGLKLKPQTRLIGDGGAATLALSSNGPLLLAEAADRLHLHHIALDGGMLENDGVAGALVVLKGCRNVSISHLDLKAAAGHGIALEACSGRIHLSRISVVGDAAIFALDSKGLEITDNTISDCGNNGIQVWRSADGEDASIVSRNRIEQIAARSGGSGENGNGINVFRAGSVLVEGNRIADCAYSAVRGNAASNIQILANSCQRIGEVALYAEFGFQGALIAGNLVDTAAAGISVTNFNVGGRLAVVQGNLIRNLKRREHEPVDKRGEGIAVEADASVTGNTVENAPTAGIVIGWGRYMRNVVVTGNLVRDARVGIAITSASDAGACFVTGNMISGATDGAIRAMDEGRLHGPDLAREPVATSGRVVVERNMAV